MENREILDLVEKYVHGQASEEEIKLVDNWYESFEKNPGLLAQTNEQEIELTMKKSFLAICKKLNL